MPNWCENVLIAEGTKEQIEDFVKSVRGKDEDGHSQFIDFNKIIPYPKEEMRKEELKYLQYQMKSIKTETELERFKKDNSITNDVLKEMMLLSLEDENAIAFLGWHTCNWGTKWNASFYGEEQFKRIDNTTITYTFDTAWSPPLPVVVAMSEKFKDMIFTLLYCEPMMDFSGFIRIKNKTILDDYHTTMKGNWCYPKKKFKKWKLDKVYNIPPTTK